MEDDSDLVPGGGDLVEDTVIVVVPDEAVCLECGPKLIVPLRPCLYNALSSSTTLVLSDSTNSVTVALILTRMTVMSLSSRMRTLTLSALMSAYRKAPPMSIDRTLRFSAAAMDATTSSDEVAAEGEGRFSYSSLSRPSPPATSLALTFSNDQSGRYLSRR